MHEGSDDINKDATALLNKKRKTEVLTFILLCFEKAMKVVAPSSLRGIAIQLPQVNNSNRPVLSDGDMQIIIRIFGIHQ